jgi:hypothetical protein
MKDGHSADALHWMFVGEGQDPNEVRTVLSELVALQHQAAAMDPKRLREEAKWMFYRGASMEDVVAHWVRAGIAEEHARPEAERIRAAAAKLRPCQRCGTPTPPDAFFMDLSGFDVCRGCNLRDEIGRSEQRGIARDLEAVGSFGMVGMGVTVATSIAAQAVEHQANHYHGQTANPFCATCKTPSGMHVTRLHMSTRAQIDPSAEWVCGNCWQKIK